MRTPVRRGLGRLLSSVRAGRGSRHLAADELARIVADADGGHPARSAHLAGCVHCAGRLRALQADLDRMAAAAGAAVDDAVAARAALAVRRDRLRVG